MKTLQKFQFESKRPFSERFTTVLPHFLRLLEGEWRHALPFMNPMERALFCQAHEVLGALNELQDDAS